MKTDEWKEKNNEYRLSKRQIQTEIRGGKKMFLFYKKKNNDNNNK